MKKTSRKITHVIDTYHLTKDVKYVIETKNGKESARFLKYTGKKHYDYELVPIYKENLDILSITNPCWGLDDGFEWLEGDKLPEPLDIDLTKIIFKQFSTHMFYDINKKPIPVVVKTDYCDGLLNDYFYDLGKLRLYLLEHPNVVSVSEMIKNPYYADSESFGNNHLVIFALPSSELIQKYLDKNVGQLNSFVFGEPYDKKSGDYLNIKKFVINEKYP